MLDRDRVASAQHNFRQGPYSPAPGRKSISISSSRGISGNDIDVDGASDDVTETVGLCMPLAWEPVYG